MSCCCWSQKSCAFQTPPLPTGCGSNHYGDDVEEAFAVASTHPPSSLEASQPHQDRGRRPPTRRSFLSLVTVAAVATGPLPLPHGSSTGSRGLTPPTASAAETVGKDPSCNAPSCLGVWDGLLADCPHGRRSGGGAGCVSSQDDTPGFFAEPWDYSDVLPLDPPSAPAAGNEGADAPYEPLVDRLALALQTTARQRGDDVRVVAREGRYLRALFADGATGEASTAEFYVTPRDTTVQFRLASTGGRSAAPFLAGRSLSNADRAERLRRALGYLKVPVLRSRRRAFPFGERDGPDEFGSDSAALGLPEEMSPGEMVLDGVIRGGFRIFGGRKGGGRTGRELQDVEPR